MKTEQDLNEEDSSTNIQEKGLKKAAWGCQQGILRFLIIVSITKIEFQAGNKV